MSVAVIIPNWNGIEHLSDCLTSLRNQTFKEFKAYLVDNGSTDQSVEFTRNNFPEVNIIKLDKNYGFAKAVNEGIRNTKEEFIALLNNDTKAGSCWLEELLKGINSDNKIGMCASKILYLKNPRIINSAGSNYRVDSVWQDRGANEKDEGRYNNEELVFGACAAAALYKRPMLDEVGLFDEDYFSYMEDADLSFRANLLDYKCLYVPAAVVHHIHMATGKKFYAASVRNYLRNRSFTLIKNMPGALIMKYFFCICLMYFINFVSIVISPRYNFECKKAYFNAVFDIIKAFPPLLKKRKQIQGNKKVSDEYIDSIFTKIGIKNYFSKK